MEVTKYMKANSQGALMAYISVKYKVQIFFNDGTSVTTTQFVNDMKVFQKEGWRWVSNPAKKYEKDGETKYAPYLGFVERCDPFIEAVLNAMDEFCMRNAQQSSQQPKVQEKANSMDACPF